MTDIIRSLVTRLTPTGFCPYLSPKNSGHLRLYSRFSADTDTFMPTTSTYFILIGLENNPLANICSYNHYKYAEKIA